MVSNIYPTLKFNHCTVESVKKSREDLIERELYDLEAPKNEVAAFGITVRSLNAFDEHRHVL